VVVDPFEGDLFAEDERERRAISATALEDLEEDESGGLLLRSVAARRQTPDATDTFRVGLAALTFPLHRARDLGGAPGGIACPAMGVVARPDHAPICRT
jgi:hypothetical protein